MDIEEAGERLRTIYARLEMRKDKKVSSGLREIFVSDHLANLVQGGKKWDKEEAAKYVSRIEELARRRVTQRQS
jgi:hypothetical protein